MGARAARPDVPVLSISGDGGFMFNVQELATAVQHGIPLVAVVFNDNAYGNVVEAAFKALGVDSILCISVNDGFVMEEWGKNQHADNIRFIPDGNAEFSDKMGMLVDKRNLGFGQRSWRYSMLVEDGLHERSDLPGQIPAS